MEETLKKYITDRIDELKNKQSYDYGFTSREEIIQGLFEMKRLARDMRIEIPCTKSFDLPYFIK